MARIHIAVLSSAVFAMGLSTGCSQKPEAATSLPPRRRPVRSRFRITPSVGALASHKRASRTSRAASDGNSGVLRAA